ncbi:MAG: helix-turn-helix transcriptional regulator [Cyanobacteria bacterium SIG26]|nr:helix-turn-helix transcriptional regulator [Cyanobacteria bacterium SIG26]
MFGKNLKKLRKNLSVTQDEMAVLLNMSSRTYASYEREENNPPYSMLRVLYSDHNVNLNWFVTGDGEMFIDKCEDTHAIILNEKSVSNYKNWGGRLSKILSENLETPYKFSKRTGISESRIENFILDSVDPTIKELNAIKANVDVSLDWLLYGQTTEKSAQTNSEVSLSTDEIVKLKMLLNRSDV